MKRTTSETKQYKKDAYNGSTVLTIVWGVSFPVEVKQKAYPTLHSAQREERNYLPIIGACTQQAPASHNKYGIW